jgi:hypothetical protein
VLQLEDFHPPPPRRREDLKEFGLPAIFVYERRQQMSWRSFFQLLIGLAITICVGVFIHPAVAIVVGVIFIAVASIIYLEG